MYYMQQLTLAEKLNTMTQLELRNLILYFEEQMLKLPQTEVPIEHYFAPGVYTRQASFKADTLAVGKIHKTEHTNIILSGKFKLITEYGIKEVVGPCVFISKPGSKKMAYFVEDTLWINVFATTETDVSKIEQAVTAKNYSELGLDQQELLE